LSNRIVRPLTAEEKARDTIVREQVMQEFPPVGKKKHEPLSTGIVAALRKARKAQGLTYESVAKQAGIPDANIVKDVEYGRDMSLAHIEAIARALGLKLELVEAK
jgi:DNA-binding phage protein